MMRLLRHRLRSLRQAPFLIRATHQPAAPLCQGYNWWDDKADQFWLARFIDHYFPTHQRINLFSCFQHPQLFLRFYKGKKIFFSGENLQVSTILQFDPIYRDHRINEVDLALGFEFRSEPNYYRFPLWICQNDFIHPDWQSWSRYRQRSLNSMILRYACPQDAQGLLHRYPATIVEV